MFPNLNAEQARYNDSNSAVADFLGMSRVSYESKKRTGRLSIDDANKLCQKYKCNYSYLFSETPIPPAMEKKKDG